MHHYLNVDMEGKPARVGSLDSPHVSGGWNSGLRLVASTLPTESSHLSLLCVMWLMLCTRGVSLEGQAPLLLLSILPLRRGPRIEYGTHATCLSPHPT